MAVAHNVDTVIFAVCDSLRYDTAEDYLTTITSYAESGIKIDQCYAPGAGTPSSMPGIMQSRLPICHDGYGLQLPPSVPTLAEAIRDAGYNTLGLHSNSYTTSEQGFDRGFDCFMDLFSASSQHDIDYKKEIEGVYPSAVDILTNSIRSSKLHNFASQIYNSLERIGIIKKRSHASATELIDTAIDWSEKTGNSQFIWLQFMDTHSPFKPPSNFQKIDGNSYSPWKIYDLNKKFTNKSEALTEAELQQLRHLYQAETRYVDSELDRLITYLKKENKWESTVLILTSDHGELFGGIEVPGRDHSVSHPNYLCEELTHVPLYIIGGAVDQTDVSGLVSSMDIAPTIIDSIGSEIPNEWVGIPIGDAQSRDTVTSALTHTRGEGVKIDSNALHVAIRNKNYGVLWWRSTHPTQIFKREPHGETFLGTPEEISGVEVESLINKAQQYTDIDVDVSDEGKIGGSVSKRLQDLGYVE